MERVVKLWTAHNPKKNINYSYNFVLFDKEGTGIEGFVDADDQNACSIVHQIKEDCVYEIYKFKPCQKRLSFRRVKHEVRIQLTGTAMIIRNDWQNHLDMTAKTDTVIHWTNEHQRSRNTRQKVGQQLRFSF